MARVLNTSVIIPVIEELVKKACYELDDNFIGALEEALKHEESPIGKKTISLLLENAKYAKEQQIAVCQDTGTTVVFLEIGEEVSWTGDSLTNAVNQGVREGYINGYLRKSIVKDPLVRINTEDNTPAVIHVDIVPGDKVKITVMPKGGGSENMGSFTTLIPSEGAEGVKNFVLKSVIEAGGRPCPPLIVGVGVGGTMDQCAILAKKALLRPIGERHKEEHYAALEVEILNEINKLGIGPLGTGGRITALDVHINYFPCHITALPVAVNFQCHASRHASITI
ncbi:Hydro-lyase, Fe-S type, tartrate/fumarate subfamily, alpha subunit [Tepidanaerobacter acetatoxydans Re1]|uniref:Hydro-lyase, Fe-S type, tartrate/fumarate subfamily, alpha subunit n=1 Tax=Tepidanaerobacter acetatoxydans (strain DSM 21804 / JCM 16047 / Re1) TaxID=1209989 RepID=F4LVD9_TEPAE|nr:fumarate hydratase [Tepidanaerobacter acetatoxydans]AEE90714.1 hydro-lyase, Fe-S type, tartrate/fumarate subfamily, alpha subunit [Tepidanaerobacter acetatoxydans Re1]CCP25255.1 Hydro-lyase, Fe-S type, tartrate/fumarate subfamily, alpha subunit [Tepidanaerobacter acetatoxydans Re1]